jgi:UDP-N-acetylglucosamine--N-acetylmuramyl-(pentapeptide) pyrophosphoryl-undecaprenol N-acetylglucosamine transferase
MGGSQGASGINGLVIGALDKLTGGAHGVACPTSELQFFHLSGPSDVEKVRRAYTEKNLRAVVHGFFGEMDTALGAATVAVSRSGASSLAEIAAMRVPSVLVPFPAATDNHQFFNAKAFQETGAAHLLEQKDATAESFANLLLDLTTNAAAREKMQVALAKWHAPQAAEQIAETMLKLIAHGTEFAGAKPHDAKGSCDCGGEHRHELRVKSAA